MLTFVDQRIRELLQVAGAVEPAIQLQENRQPSARQTRLHALLAGLNTPPSAARIRSTLDALHEEKSVTEGLEERAYSVSNPHRVVRECDARSVRGSD